MTVVTYDDLFAARALEIQRRVERRVKAAGIRRCRVSFMAFAADEMDLPLDNLDQVAVRGPAVLVHEAGHLAWMCSASSPTWLDVALLAERAVRKCRDRRRPLFLDGLGQLRREPLLTVCKFLLTT